MRLLTTKNTLLFLLYGYSKQRTPSYLSYAATHNKEYPLISPIRLLTPKTTPLISPIRLLTTKNTLLSLLYGYSQQRTPSYLSYTATHNKEHPLISPIGLLTTKTTPLISPIRLLTTKTTPLIRPDFRCTEIAKYYIIKVTYLIRPRFPLHQGWSYKIEGGGGGGGYSIADKFISNEKSAALIVTEESIEVSNISK